MRAWIRGPNRAGPATRRARDGRAAPRREAAAVRRAEGRWVFPPADRKAASSCAPRAQPRTRPAAARTRSRIIAGMGWVFLEILAALAIAIAIVWWTFPKPPKKGDDER